ncbi:MAG: polyamine aminopropyltransferase [Candidatus Cloacimonetes bacterium]|nr:polyamine aminopropyltransferase [Candidatus Cloacimonadota bacterium]
MELWFTEKHSPGRGLTYQVKQTLYQERSQFQTIDIVETEDFGLVMLLDGVIMVTEKDEFVYHEMLSQPPLFTHPAPREVLIIGGGDCGTLKRVLIHKTVEHVTQVEIDEMVTRVAGMYFPLLTDCTKDPRVDLVFDDGTHYLRNNQDRFDLILIDSTDPVGPAEGLFQRDFYADCQRALKEDGILCIQSESPYIDALREVIVQANRDLRGLFPFVFPYLTPIQTYQAGLWMFQMASNRYNPINPEVGKRIDSMGSAFQFYNRAIHDACFAMPEFIKRMLV